MFNILSFSAQLTNINAILYTLVTTIICVLFSLNNSYLEFTRWHYYLEYFFPIILKLLYMGIKFLIKITNFCIKNYMKRWSKFKPTFANILVANLQCEFEKLCTYHCFPPEGGGGVRATQGL